MATQLASSNVIGERSESSNVGLAPGLGFAEWQYCRMAVQILLSTFWHNGA